MRRQVVAWVFAGLALAIELPAMGLLFAAEWGPAVWLAPYAHVLAAMNCKMASHHWNGNPLVEQDAVFLTALCVPVFGPGFAWLFPLRRGREEVQDAHAIFEQFEDQAARRSAGAAAMPDAWEMDPDQPVAMSFAEILQHGSLDHKRNAIRMLADFGEKRHLRLLREVLVGETGELRLCAFLELNRVAKPFEQKIFELCKELRENGENAVTLATLATVHRDLGQTGLLDREMARYHLRQARDYVQRAYELSPADPHTTLTRAAILCDAGEFGEASASLEQLGEEDRRLYDCRLLRARIGYYQRDFAAVRDEVRALRASGMLVPEWMECLEHVPWGQPVGEVVW